MVQGEVRRTPPVGSNALMGLTEKEIHEIQQYEKIVRMRDTVLSGNHPAIKLPPGMKAQPISSQTKPLLESGIKSAVSKSQQSCSSNVRNLELGSHAFAVVGASTCPTMPKSSESRKTEINPIFLEKSDELIKAELQLQRQRLERSLRDEVEQRRVSKQAQAEPLVVFDLSDVLAKALTLVQATTVAPLPTDKDLTANDEAASDSFDDNTFYSSQHDTPESNMTSRICNMSEEAQVLDTSRSQQEPASLTNRDHPPSPIRDNHAADSLRPLYPNQRGSLVDDAPSRTERVLVPGLNNYVGRGDSLAEPGQVTISGEQGHSEDTGNLETRLRARRHGHNSYTDAHVPPTLVRSHNLLPVAPQPTQISPLAVAGQRTPILNSGVATVIGTPAQVAALRSELTVATSSDSSSQGGRDSDKKGKKKKRKADQQAPEAEVGPYIKAEPRSPSPMTAPSYIRPSKRQRNAQGQATEPDYAELRFAHPPANNSYEQHPYRDQRVPITYQGSVPYPQRTASTAMSGDTRYGREYVDERQIPGDAFIRRPSPGAPSFQYSSREAHPPRTVSRVILNDSYRESSHMFREPREGPRMSVRPEGDAFIVPPKPPATRFVVDAFGREYIEPPRPSPRQSVAPSARPAEPDTVYERVPPRAMPGYSGDRPYEDGSVVYTRPQAVYAMSRRYVTQSEYIPRDYRDSQHLEYSTQPMGAGEFVQVLAPQDRRPIAGRPREYISRASSLRPLEPSRFEAPQSYGHMHTVRPEAPGREYSGSMHPDGRYPEGPQAYEGEHGGGQTQQPYIRQEYSVRPADRYHEPRGEMRGSDEIAFIERPRAATQEIVYVDDARREVYR